MSNPDLEQIIGELSRERQRRDSADPIAVARGLVSQSVFDRRNELLEAAIERLKADSGPRPADQPPITKPSQRAGRPVKPLSMPRPGQINHDLRSRLNLPKSNPQVRLGTARDQLADALASGQMVSCQCCAQTAKIYSRGIYSRLVYVLELLAKGGPLTSAQLMAHRKTAGGGDHTSLQHFGLIEPAGERWSITDDGRLFLAGDLAVPHKIIMWNRQLLGVDTSIMVKITDVQGLSHFDTDIWSAKAVAEATI